MSTLVSRKFLIAASAAMLMATSACSGGGTEGGGGKGGSQKGNAGMNAIQDRSASSDAGKLYVEKCSMCHRQFGMGSAILARRVEKGKENLEDRDDLTADYVISAARQGIGNMPRIPRGEVSDEQLKTIADYLEKGSE